MADFYGFHVGKYTSPMDPMGIWIPKWNLHHEIPNILKAHNNILAPEKKPIAEDPSDWYTYPPWN